MAKEKDTTKRTELFGIRVTALDRQRIEFLARLNAKSPTSIAALLLSEAARAEIHKMTAPNSAPDESGDTSDARAI